MEPGLRYHVKLYNPSGLHNLFAQTQGTTCPQPTASVTSRAQHMCPYRCLFHTVASLSHASKRGIFKCREKTKLASKTCFTASPDVQNSSRQLQPTTNMHVQHSSQPLSTPWSRSKLSLPKLKASLAACFRHLLAENFFPRFRKLRRSQKTSVANQNGQQPTKYSSAQRKLPRTVENFENSLAPEDSYRTTSAAQMLTFSQSTPKPAGGATEKNSPQKKKKTNNHRPIRTQRQIIVGYRFRVWDPWLKFRIQSVLEFKVAVMLRAGCGRSGVNDP